MPMRCLLTLALLCALPAAALCSPTSLNLIPTGEVIGAGAYSLQLELDGHATPFSRGAELWAMTQLGLGDRFEIGFDMADATDDEYWLLDAKWQVLAESARLPAVAIGGLDLLDQADARGLYLAATLNPGAGPLSLTAGVLRDDATRAMLGLQYDADDLHTLYADWTTGPEAYATVGIWRNVTDALGVLLYWGRSNTWREDDFVGLGFYLWGQWK